MQRIIAGTDIAKMGVWDADSDKLCPPDSDLDSLLDSLSDRAARGELRAFDIGADGSGFVDVYIDEEVPDDIRELFVAKIDDGMILVPSGRLRVDGIECLLNGESEDSKLQNIVVLPPGKYEIVCWRCDDESDARVADSEKKLKKIVGADDVEFYDKLNTSQLVFGCLSPFLTFAVAIFFIRWFFALPLSIFVFILSFHLSEWLVTLSKRYRELASKIPDLRERLEPPSIVIKLHHLENLKAD